MSTPYRSAEPPPVAAFAPFAWLWRHKFELVTSMVVTASMLAVWHAIDLYREPRPCVETSSVIDVGNNNASSCDPRATMTTTAWANGTALVRCTCNAKGAR